jgi:hypothetical protein
MTTARDFARHARGEFTKGKLELDKATGATVWTPPSAKQKSFMASATGYAQRHRDTPREAALAFFEANPRARKCNVTEGELDGQFFSVRISTLAAGGSARRWVGVTRQAANTLPPNDLDAVPQGV